MESKQINIMTLSQYKFMKQFDNCNCDEYTNLYEKYEKCLKIINSTDEICSDNIEIKNKKNTL